MKIPLSDWAARHYNPPPSLWVLRIAAAFLCSLEPSHAYSKTQCCRRLPARSNRFVSSNVNSYLNGTWWSYPAHPSNTPRQAAGWARLKSAFSPDVIRWTDRPADWPARSRT